MVAKRFVVDAVVEKRLVEVAEVVVALMPVKFWSVLDPVTKRLEKVPDPPEERTQTLLIAKQPLVRVIPLARVEVPVPVIERADAVSGPLKVVVPLPVTVSAPMEPVARLKLVAKRLVLEAVVAKELVVVALVEVLFDAVKFCKVLDPVAKRLESIPSPVMVVLPK